MSRSGDIAPDWISLAPQDVPAATGITYTRVREAIASGELRVVKHSPKRVVVMRRDIEAWLTQMQESA